MSRGPPTHEPMPEAEEAGLSDADRNALLAYVHERRDDLLLQHWWVEVEKELPPGDMAIAQTYIRNEGNVARMRFAADFRQRSAEEQRQTVIHELLHLHLDRFASDFDEALEESASRPAYDMAHALMRHSYERMTALADAIEWPPAK